MEANHIKLIVGLGNPGEQYDKTYHNVGRYVTELFKAWHAERSRGWQFFEPAGFMNESGASISDRLRQSPFKPEQLLIIHDDSDQLRGDFKIVFDGGAGGHRGVASVIERLGTKEFWRLKIGIREPQEAVRKKADAFVLSRWQAEDEAVFTAVAKEAWERLGPTQ